MRQTLLAFGLVIIAFNCFAQDISLLQQLNGRYDYVAIGNTMNTVENGTLAPCIIGTDSTANLQLEEDDTIIGAFLYWAGSGDGDFNIFFNNQPISADRTFSDSLDENRTFFAAYKDVSTEVINQGSVDYTVGELDVSDVIDAYCSTGTNFAGWALIVVYENAELPLNQINIYDGLESVPTELSITLNNLNVLDNEGAKIGFVAWEGDRALEVNESLRINGNLISNPPLNPATNAFNGTNSFTGSDTLYNMDIDVYSLQDNINVGDDTATISLTSGQDFVMINTIITVLNSQLPDATIAIESINSDCLERDIDVNYLVSNVNSTDVLPANTPIAFYIDGNLIAQSATQNSIPIGESEQGNIQISLAEDLPDTVEIMVFVDDDGMGNSTILESNETNNDNAASYTLKLVEIIEDPQNLQQCDETDNDGISTFNLTQNTSLVLGLQSNVTASYYRSLNDAEMASEAIDNPDEFSNTTNPQTIFMRLESEVDTSCFRTSQFQVEVILPPTQVELPNLTSCDFRADGLGLYNLNEQDSILNEANPATQITYHLTANDAVLNVNPIENPSEFENTIVNQIIYARAESVLFSDCFSIQDFQLKTMSCGIEIPTGFSPNGDATNDTFTITGLRELYPNFELRIYNRWGRLVFEGNQNIEDWNGFSNQPKIGNKNLPVGTYFYWLRLQPSDSDELVGYIYLNR